MRFAARADFLWQLPIRGTRGKSNFAWEARKLRLSLGWSGTPHRTYPKSGRTGPHSIAFWSVLLLQPFIIRERRSPDTSTSLAGPAAVSVAPFYGAWTPIRSRPHDQLNHKVKVAVGVRVGL
jgi:hypothetical protein